MSYGGYALSGTDRFAMGDLSVSCERTHSELPKFFLTAAGKQMKEVAKKIATARRWNPE